MSKSSNVKQKPTNGANPPAQADQIAPLLSIKQNPNESNPPAKAEESAAPAPDFIDQVPPAVAPLFSNPPVLKTEDPNAYKALLNEVGATIRPKDQIEFWWTRDFTDLTWEILRYRRMRKAILETGEREALRARFRMLLEDGRPSDETLDQEAAQLAKNWFTDPGLREPGAKIGVTEDELAALVYLYREKELAGIEKQIASAETRRNKLLREMHSRRQTAEYRERLAELARSEVTEVTGPLAESFERWKKRLLAGEL
jgi:hypothetical protein